MTARWITRWKAAVGLVLGLERLVFLVEVLADHARQLGQVDAAGGHHFGRVGILDQRQQQVLERRIFVRTVGRVLERRVESLLEVLCETGHGHSIQGVMIRSDRLLMCKGPCERSANDVGLLVMNDMGRRKRDFE